jgi:hypothetical protein
LYDKLVSQKSKHGREETEEKIHSDFQEKRTTSGRYKNIIFSQSMKGMSDYQKKTMLKFRRCEKEKLRAVEKRTVTVKEIDEIKELAIMHPLRIKQRKRERNAIS